MPTLFQARTEAEFNAQSCVDVASTFATKRHWQSRRDANEYQASRRTWVAKALTELGTSNRLFRPITIFDQPRTLRPSTIRSNNKRFINLLMRRFWARSLGRSWPAEAITGATAIPPSKRIPSGRRREVGIYASYRQHHGNQTTACISHFHGRRQALHIPLWESTSGAY